MSLFSTLRSFLPSINSFLNPPPPTGPFPSTYTDVLHTRALLKSLSLPTELVLLILDHAQYWPSHTYHMRSNGTKTTAAARGGRPSAAALCLEAPVYRNPIGNAIRASGEKCKIKAVEFDIVSYDQGWTSENTQGTFATSSWLEVSILRDARGDSPPPSPPQEYAWISGPMEWRSVRPAGNWAFVKRPGSAGHGEGDFAWYLQGNQVAADRQEYRVVWSEGGGEGNEGAGSGEGFLEELKDGDRILVWARAKYPGWQCIVESIKVTVRYGF